MAACLKILEPCVWRRHNLGWTRGLGLGYLVWLAATIKRRARQRPTTRTNWSETNVRVSNLKLAWKIGVDGFVIMTETRMRKHIYRLCIMYTNIHVIMFSILNNDWLQPIFHYITFITWINRVCSFTTAERYNRCHYIFNSPRTESSTQCLNFYTMFKSMQISHHREDYWHGCMGPTGSKLTQ